MGLFDRLAAALGFKDDTIKPEPRQDPEDAKARAHAEAVVATQKEESFPVQTLRGKRKPADVSKSWDDLKLPDPDPQYECWIDVYDGPSGKGYVINYEFNRSGTLIRKALNVGPEEWRERDWEEVVEPPVR